MLTSHNILDVIRHCIDNECDDDLSRLVTNLCSGPSLPNDPNLSKILGILDKFGPTRAFPALTCLLESGSHECFQRIREFGTYDIVKGHLSQAMTTNQRDGENLQVLELISRLTKFEGVSKELIEDCKLFPFMRDRIKSQDPDEVLAIMSILKGVMGSEIVYALPIADHFAIKIAECRQIEGFVDTDLEQINEFLTILGPTLVINPQPLIFLTSSICFTQFLVNQYHHHFLVFAMGRHARVGAESPVSQTNMNDDMMGVIFGFLEQASTERLSMMCARDDDSEIEYIDSVDEEEERLISD